jgi:hypothetical protein
VGGERCAVTIDPKLYEKYTGKRPGDAMNRLGRALAQNEARKVAARDSLERTRLLSRVLLMFGFLGRWLKAVQGGGEFTSPGATGRKPPQHTWGAN